MDFADCGAHLVASVRIGNKPISLGHSVGMMIIGTTQTDYHQIKTKKHGGQLLKMVIRQGKGHLISNTLCK